MNTAFQIMMLIKALQAKLGAAKSDGQVTMDEKKELAIAAIAGVVDILAGVLPMEAIEAALDNVSAIRARAKAVRAKTAAALDQADEAVSEILD